MVVLVVLEANIFAIEPKQPPTEQSQNATIEPVIQTEEIINPDDIPF
jgi:hypothetical protein